MTGLVIKSSSNRHYVAVDDRVFPCVMRGKLRRQGRVYTGDRVRVTLLDDGTGVIEEILERDTLLPRPQVANVTRALVLMSVQEPAWQSAVVDRLLVVAGSSGLDTVVCATKTDLDTPGRASDLLGVYERAGYRVVATSARQGLGLDEFRQALLNQVSVLSGVSGVGKSSLLNAMWPGLKLRTGEVATSGRGRHTTRSAEMLLPEPGIVVVDTPGFSALEPVGISEPDLAYWFPEFRPYLGTCQFSDCRHDQEPGCSIKEQVGTDIDRSRYKSYLAMLSEIRQREATRY